MKQKLSAIETLSCFMSLAHNIESKYNFNRDNLELCDRATQDVLHQLELGSYEDSRKYGPKLSKIRQARRIFKDECEHLQPLIDFLQDKNNIVVVRKLDEVLGKIRKEEKAKQNRIYNPRVIRELPFLKETDDTCEVEV